MSAPDAALVVAVIALSGTLVASQLTARASRRAAFVQELRVRTADAFREAFAVQHAMEWVTWHALHDSAALDEAMKREYAAEVHRALPALEMRFVGSHGPPHEEAIEQLSALADKSQQLYKVLPIQLAEVMALAADPSRGV